MERFKTIEKTQNYFLELDKEENVLILHVTNPALARRLRGSLFYSYNGVRFINAAGGRSKSLETLHRTLRLTRKALKFIKQFSKTKTRR